MARFSNDRTRAGRAMATICGTAAMLMFGATAALAGALSIANVTSGRWECTYANSCVVSFDDTVGDLFFTHYDRVSGFYTRTVNGLRDSWSGGRVGYLYRLDLTGSTFGECVHGVVMGVSSIDKVNYTLSGHTDLVVVASGWLGSVGVVAADYDATRGLIHVHFENYVCPGQTSYYFGFSSTSTARRPTLVTLFTAGHPSLVQAKARVP